MALTIAMHRPEPSVSAVFSKPMDWLVNLEKYLRPGARLDSIDRDPAQGADVHF
ncbi:MAG: hypothetical protein NT151_12720 [Acidobacteria bacterium]|nr:hypothetical protein [Acidobacteriota bacterium]